MTSLIGIENLDPILEKVEINDVWGVGRQLTKFYQKHGIYNAKQLKNKSNTWIKKSLNDDINSVSNIIDESLQSLELKKQWSSNEE